LKVFQDFSFISCKSTVKRYITMKAILAILAFLGLFACVFADCTQQSYCVGKNGRDGRDGTNGMNGRDGTNGNNGLNGKNGLDGLDGKHCDGKNGTNGMNGRDGKNGTSGINGRDGQNGTNGMNGKIGISGKDGVDGKNCDVKNWKECAWVDLDYHKDIGVIKKCAFKKRSSKTWLKVVVSSNMRIAACDYCCNRWYVTFDGSECSAPVPIDVAVFMAEGMNQNLLRPRILRGHCHIPHAKTVNVEFHVGKCKQHKGGNAVTGWQSTTNFFIEEVEAPQM